MANDARLVGLAEIAEMLGVTKRSASRYALRDDFPTPLVELAMGPVWLADDVEEWDHARPAVRPGPRPGRRSRQSQ